MVAISGSLSSYVVRAFSNARFGGGDTTSAKGFTDTESAVFDLSPDALEYMSEKGLLDQNEKVHTASILAKAHRKERAIQELTIKYL